MEDEVSGKVRRSRESASASDLGRALNPGRAIDPGGGWGRESRSGARSASRGNGGFSEQNQSLRPIC